MKRFLADEAATITFGQQILDALPDDLVGWKKERNRYDGLVRRQKKLAKAAETPQPSLPSVKIADAIKKVDLSAAERVARFNCLVFLRQVDVIVRTQSFGVAVCRVLAFCTGRRRNSWTGSPVRRRKHQRSTRMWTW